MQEIKTSLEIISGALLVFGLLFWSAKMLHDYRKEYPIPDAQTPVIFQKSLCYACERNYWHVGITDKNLCPSCEGRGYI